MLAKERKDKIMELLQENGAVTTMALVESFGVSLETVRRDLLRMETAGLLQKVHGGAVPCSAMESFQSLTKRETVHEAEKAALAKAAMAFIKEGDIIGIDAGSTAKVFAAVLRDTFENLTVVTHSLDVFRILAGYKSFSVILCGGHFLPSENAFYGALSEDMLEKLHMQKVFLFPSAISLRDGIGDFQPELFSMQRLLLSRGDHVFFLADSSKFEKKGLLRITEIRSEYTLVTDAALPETLISLYRENGVHLICGKEKTK